jgi:hypothetical protein
MNGSETSRNLFQPFLGLDTLSFQMPNHFELKHLREEAEKYTYHDAGTHGVWPRLVWERRNKSPVARLDDAVESIPE